MFRKFSVSLLTSAALMTQSYVVFAQGDTPAPENASVYFIQPTDGAVVSSPVKVIFGLSGIGIAPAGANLENTGHHHLIIDAPLPNTSLPVPSDDNHKHFGKGQTETTVELSAGTHTLQLLLGDWKHVPHENIIASEQITSTVE